jgi:hypothetical protein
MKAILTIVVAYLASAVTVVQAQTEVITNDKPAWEMTAQELQDVTCRSYRDKAIASYSAFGQQIPQRIQCDIQRTKERKRSHLRFFN